MPEPASDRRAAGGPPGRAETVIGLEVHAQLMTRTKLFCPCAVSFDAAPNRRVCPVCLGHPGALPVVNRRAVELALRIGLAVGGEVHPVSRWARKHYFYPDLPKGYQITQHAEPLVTGGAIPIEVEGRRRSIRIARMHLEEDAGRLRHPERAGERWTRVDLNRCGVPLLEIVSEPEIRTPEEARCYVATLKQLLEYCEVCDGELERGSLRCDANLSLRPAGSAELGTRTEIKNLNSLRGIEQALACEQARQRRALARGARIAPATLLWDAAVGEVRVMRAKEDAPDYRYVPEPDLPPLEVAAGWLTEVRASLPELPGARRARLAAEYGIRAYDARLLTATRERAAFFEAVASQVPDAQQAANFIASTLLGRLRESGARIGEAPLEADVCAALLRRLADGTVSRRRAQEVLAERQASGAAIDAIIAARGGAQITDEACLCAWAREILATHPRQVDAYRTGRAALLRFFMGAMMRLSAGRAHPRRAEAILRRMLDAGSGQPPAEGGTP